MYYACWRALKAREARSRLLSPSSRVKRGKDRAHCKTQSLGGTVMPYRRSTGAVVIAVVAACATFAISMTMTNARVFDESHYPDWKGQWMRLPVAGIRGNPSWDPNKSDGLAQQAPLTPEYQAKLEASLADQAAGGAGLDRDLICMTAGMPRMMNLYSTMEIVVMLDQTYILMSTFNDTRRIFTDGRDWPADMPLSYAGYSIGKWIDVDGDGRYDVLEVETRGFRGMRTLDSTSIPLHEDNQTIIKERIYSNKANPNIMHDEITIIDNAFTRPWTVTKDYRRGAQAQPVWRESECIESNSHVLIGNEHYMISADGLLMPAKKNQAPPDLRYFNKQ
jgi:hypothetical protein